MIRKLKHSLFAVALLVGFSMTASAQKEGDKNPPPKKENPPIIVVKPKEDKPKEDKPKGDKKPGANIFGNKEEDFFE